jgi:hypothetical protein
MHLNGILKAESLSVGQRLIIPLPSSKDTAPNTASQKNRQKSSRSTQPGSAKTTDTPHLRKVVASASQPCPLARNVAEQLGVSVSAFFSFLDAESISVSYADLKVAVVCGLAPAEAYTLERLLARHGVKLLVFKGDETPRIVIEELANRLGISFRLSNPDTATELPLTYLFPTANSGKDITLTIRPDVTSSK